MQWKTGARTPSRCARGSTQRVRTLTRARRHHGAVEGGGTAMLVVAIGLPSVDSVGSAGLSVLHLWRTVVLCRTVAGLSVSAFGRGADGRRVHRGRGLRRWNHGRARQGGGERCGGLGAGVQCHGRGVGRAGRSASVTTQLPAVTTMATVTTTSVSPTRWEVRGGRWRRRRLVLAARRCRYGRGANCSCGRASRQGAMRARWARAGVCAVSRRCSTVPPTARPLIRGARWPKARCPLGRAYPGHPRRGVDRFGACCVGRVGQPDRGGLWRPR